MAIKRKKGDGGGGANWMDTYGDMVTLLLCFFVLLYSMSTISEEAWKNLVMSFNPNAVAEATETPEGGSGPSADDDQTGVIPNLTQEMIDASIEDLYEQLSQYAQESGQLNSMSVTRGDGKVFISFNNAVFFDGDKSDLRAEAKPILDAVSGMLDQAVRSIDEVRVLGHTAQALPNRPNNVVNDRTLASQRATNVVIYVQMNSKVDPARLISEGIGQWRPIDDNTNPEGQARNRRVEMIVSGRNLEQELSGGLQEYRTE